MVQAGGTLFCHGSPRSDEEIITALSPDARLAPMLDGVAEDVVVCGHTHHQFDRRVGGKRIVNAGSVGRPYEDEPAAYWLWLGPEPELRRTDYDIAAAVERLRASGCRRSTSSCCARAWSSRSGRPRRRGSSRRGPRAISSGRRAVCDELRIEGVTRGWRRAFRRG